MKGLARLAWKNLSRYKKRTTITALVLGVGLGIFIWMDAWLLGAEIESERNLVWYETSSLRLVDREAWEKKETFSLSRVLEQPQELLSRLEEKHLTATPRIQFGGEMIFYEGFFPTDGYLPVRAVALDPVRDEGVFSLKNAVTEGRYINPGAMEVVMGSWLAQDIGAQLGAPIILETQTRYGRKQTLDLTIVGLITTDNPIINRGSILMPLDIAQTELEMDGAVTEIDIRLEDYKQAVRYASDLNATFGPEIAVLTWKDLAADYLAISSSKQGGSKVMLLLVIIIALVGISNTMLMAVFERIREVGMMQALGMTVPEVRRLFLWESAGIGLLGSTFGLLLGILLTFPMVVWGMDFGFMLQDIDIGYRIATVMKAAWNFPTMVGAFIAGIIISVGVALLTLRKMLGWTITQSLTHQ